MSAVLKPLISASFCDRDALPARPVSLARLARTFTEEAIKTVAEVMRDPEASHRDRIAAADLLLNRGWGRAPQAIDVNVTQHGQELSTLTRDVLLQLAAGQRPDLPVLIDGHCVPADVSDAEVVANA